MKFKVGDKIRIIEPLPRMRSNRVGTKGEIIEYRTYCTRTFGHHPTHYRVKFDGYKIPHEYLREEIEEFCELIKEEVPQG